MHSANYTVFIEIFSFLRAELSLDFIRFWNETSTDSTGNLQNFVSLKLEGYIVFHRFRQAKFGNGGSILSWANFRYCPSCLKNKARDKRGQNRLKNNRLANNNLNPSNSL